MSSNGSADNREELSRRCEAAEPEVEQSHELGRDETMEKQTEAQWLLLLLQTHLEIAVRWPPRKAYCTRQERDQIHLCAFTRRSCCVVRRK